jgi:GNAT superfamily N-acetyltransferase
MAAQLPEGEHRRLPGFPVQRQHRVSRTGGDSSVPRPSALTDHFRSPGVDPGWRGAPVQQAYPRRMGIEVLPATGRWDDFASFMVPRKPGGRGCVCMAYRNSSLDMPGRIAHMRALCDSEPGPGVLAYVDGEVAGWCSVAPKFTYRALVNSRTIPHVRDEGAWSVVCFVVRPGFRRRGLMHQLLDGAVGHAHAMGATALEGYPVDPGSERTDQTSGYVGTVQLFEAHEFRRVRPTAGRRGGKPRWLVRRELR